MQAVDFLSLSETSRRPPNTEKFCARYVIYVCPKFRSAEDKHTLLQFLFSLHFDPSEKQRYHPPIQFLMNLKTKFNYQGSKGSHHFIGYNSEIIINICTHDIIYWVRDLLTLF